MIRKTLLISIMTILVVLLGYTVYAGFNVGKFNIPGYSYLDKKAENLNQLILEYESKNSDELMQKEKQLTNQISEYNEQKQEYEKILLQKETDLINYDTANCYDVDFLWTRIGNYATQRDLDLEFNISKNSSDKANTDYILTDLSFIATGEYIEIANFIQDLEDDPRLEFEIRNFAMKKEKTKVKDDSGKEVEKTVLKATFTVYSVAINRETLTQLTTQNNTNTPGNTTGANF